MQTPELSNYFNGVFDNLGIVVEETGEKFTIHNTGKQFTFENGIKESKVDFIVPVQLANIQNMVMHAKDGKIDLAESWRIVDVLFTSLTQETLKNPVMSGNWGRILAGVEDLIHVYLINPTGGEASRHTLIYVNDRWLVVKGLHGKPKRTYRMTPEESLEYQRTVFKAIKKDTYCGWWEFSTWYKEWRKKVSVTY
ncbi:MAG: hypothetical protein O3A55_02430 [Bacteroidetes bacterium]|nr:hypothetical protein [Bacteroidota bacterium]